MREIAFGIALLAQTVQGPTMDPYQFPFPYTHNVNHTEYKRDTPDDGIALCRLQFTSNRREADGSGWYTDYPNAGRNLSIRFSEMTTAHVVMVRGDPVVWVVKPETVGLHRCPLLLASDVGTLAWTSEDVSLMREYLAKGGVVWTDDSWGPLSWEQWTAAWYQVAPGGYIEELRPPHPIYSIYYRVPDVPQISNLNYWKRFGGEVSERGELSPRAELHAGYLADGHLAMLTTFNTDIMDAAEREADSAEYFDTFAADGYALMINLLVYVMAHA